MFDTLDALRQQIRMHGLEAHQAQIVNAAKPAIWMERTRAEDDEIPVGHSKLGGLPDLPADFRWPYDGKTPLTFLAQFKFSELAPLDDHDIMPDHACPGDALLFL
ncbi:MAG: DUF1963 domain-containing protein [Chloroflexota bacterium]